MVTNWERTELKNIGDIITGSTPPTSDKENYGNDFLWASPVDLGENKFVYKTATRLSAKGFDKTRKLPKGSILVVCIGSTIGKVGIATQEMSTNQQINSLICSNEFDSEFIYYALNDAFQKHIGLIATQAVPIINKGQFSNFQVIIPPLFEQRAIAAALSDADGYIVALEKIIAKKCDIKQGAMQELQGPKDGWIEKPIGELFAISGGRSASRAQLSDSGHFYLHYGDIHTSPKTYIDTDEDKAVIPRLNVPLSKLSSDSLLQDGDVVFVDASEDDIGASKHVVIRNQSAVPFIAGLHTIVAKPLSDETDRLFREYCFQTTDVIRQFIHYAAGTKVTGVSKTTIKKITINYPKSTTEQHSIARILSDMDAEINALTAKLNKAKLIKQGMMEQLLTGKIRLEAESNA